MSCINVTSLVTLHECDSEAKVALALPVGCDADDGATLPVDHEERLCKGRVVAGR